jgi:hypothetical protein
MIIRTWAFTDSCGRQITWVQSISITDNEPPEILDVPADTVVNCIDNLPIPPDLVWIDNCDTGGIVIPDVTSDGGTNPEVYTNTWTVTDACGNISIVQQSINVFNESVSTLDASICPGDTVWFNGMPYTVGGFFSDTIPNGAAFGCDSILNITITELDHTIEVLDEIICDGDTIVINGVAYDSDGVYADTIFDGSINGCDSILNITITTLESSTTDINESLCPDESVLINGVLYDAEGMYSDTIFGGA